MGERTPKPAKRQDPLLDAGLRAAFSKDESCPAWRSVLESLGGAGAPVHLPDPESDPSPLVDTRSGQMAATGRQVGRYHIVGAIAEGRSCILLKCRDRDLGRDVAMKVLRAEHAHDPEAVKGFIEEAQIGAQLQHPGIIPVYELGLLDDDRPFFTMKLVKGRDLASLLADRKDPKDDLVRFLGIFEQVAKTMAYAHARDVIHRNLEPRNILVGNYGEVKVVDWGFSRVRESTDPGADPDRTRSQISLIETIRGVEEDGDAILERAFGNASYLPPEQATGDLRKLDQRSDVFTLGAILLEILTGEPPYTGRTTEEILFCASRVRLEEALARLDEVRPESELDALVRECLSPGPKTRPRDAGVVARRMEEWLSGAEENARRSRLRAEEERIEAVAARRSRSLTVLVAVSLILVVGIGVGLYLWMTSSARTARARADRIARAAVEEAELLRGAADGDEAAPLAAWAEALEAARAARRLADDPNVDRALATRARSLEEEVATAEADARRTVERRTRNDRLQKELTEIRASDLLGPPDPARGKRYAAAFADAGVPLDPGKIRAAFPDGERGEEVRGALEDWVVRALYGRDPEAGPPAGLYEGIDPDPDRRWILSTARRLRSRGGSPGSAFAALLDTSTSSAVLRMAGAVLFFAGDPTGAVPFLERAVSVDPRDFHARMLLGYAHLRRRGPRPDEAVAQLTAAVGLRPESTAARVALGDALAHAGRDAEAERIFREALEATGGAPAVQARLAAHLLATERVSEGERLLESAKQTGEGDPRVLLVAGLHRLEEGDAAGAVRDLRVALDRAPGCLDVHRAWIEALQRQDRIGEAVDFYRKLVATDSGFTAGRVLLAQCLARRGDYEEALGVLDTAATQVPDDADVLMARGQARLGIGQVQAAIADFERVLELRPESPDALRRHAVALSGLGDVLGCYQDLRSAIELAPGHPRLNEDLGMLLLRHGEYSAAERSLGRALELAPRSASIWFGKGMTLTFQGREEEAIEAFRAALECRDRMLCARAELYALLDVRGELDAEIRAQQARIRIHPADAGARLALALAFMRRGRYEEALAATEKADGSAEARLLTGRILDRLRRPDEAAARYRAAVSADPSLTEAWYLIGLRSLGLGEFAEARRALGRAAAEPSATSLCRLGLYESLLETLRMEELEADLDRIRSGDYRPETPKECLEIARLFFRRGESVPAATWFRRVWDADAGSFPPPHDENAFMAARSAWGAGRENPGWRALAYDWLSWGYGFARLASGRHREHFRRVLGDWLADPGFEEVREGNPPADTPEAERLEWEELWARIAETAGDLSRRREGGR